jgi:sigma-B regulation protein RsbU (phosphoserine phosphatase)
VALQPGDRIVFYSDGLIEAANERDEFFGDTRLGEVVAASSGVGPRQFIEDLLRELRAWTGPAAELQDDVTVVVVDIGQPCSEPFGAA